MSPLPDPAAPGSGPVPDQTPAHNQTGTPAPAATQLDLRGLVCPLPVVRTRRAVRDLPPGASLEVLVTDPAAVIDFPCFCHHAGLELVHSEHQEGLLRFLIRKPA